MGIFGRKRPPGRPHPRPEPMLNVPLSAAALKDAFQSCVDFTTRELRLAGDPARVVTLCAVDGMVRSERVNDYILRPLAQDEALRKADLEGCFRLLASGALYNLSVSEVKSTDEAVFALMEGSVVLWFEGLNRALKCGVATEEKRSIGDPEDEPAAKAGKDSFVEGVRTNTSLVRRRLRSAHLRIEEQVVGRQTRTPVDVIYLEGIARPEIVAEVKKRLEEMDIDGVINAGHVEQYLCDRLVTPFPQLLATQRPDRFSANLLAGRVGLIVDGLPLGFLLPGTVGLFLAAEQDRTDNWMVSRALTVLRYAAMLLSLFLPAVYVSAVLFHSEMIPLALAEAIIRAKAEVPFGTVFEAVMLLLAFEVIQEAGLRLPGNLGQTVSILGGLVVGSAAVEAKIISPAVLIVVAVAGVAGYTIPSQDFAGGMRLWRLGLTLAAGLGGLLGVTLMAAVLVGHLAGLESFGVAYLAPFAAQPGAQVEGHSLFRVPLPWVKLRPAAFEGKNRRNQR